MFCGAGIPAHSKFLIALVGVFAISHAPARARIPAEPAPLERNARVESWTPRSERWKLSPSRDALGAGVLSQLNQSEIASALADFAARQAVGRNPAGVATYADAAARWGISVDLARRVGHDRSILPHDMMTMAPHRLARAIWRVDHPKERYDHPGEAVAQRVRQWQDEFGVIPEDALQNAVEEQRAMQAAFRPWAAAGFQGAPRLPPGIAAIAGIDSRSWAFLGPNNIGGRIRSILIHPTDPTKMWIGSVSGGIWKSTNSGEEWSIVNDFMSNMAVGCMAIDPVTPATMYAGTGEGYFNGHAIQGAGIFKTTDGGATWNQLASTTSSDWQYVNRIAISKDGAALLAGTRRGLWRSTNGGTNWANVLSTDTDIQDVDFHPTSANHALAATRYGDVWHSTDGGATWALGAGLPRQDEFLSRIEICYAPSNGAIAYASVNNTRGDSGEIWRTTDSGTNWARRNAGDTSQYLGSQGWYDNIIWVDPVNPDTLVVGGIDLWRSNDGGATLSKISTWQQNQNSVHADHHMIVHHPNFNGTTNRTVFLGNDGGLYKTDNIYTSEHTTGYRTLLFRMGITQGYGGAVNESNSIAWMGCQDNGTLRWTGTETWVEAVGGDGGYCAADQVDSRFFYGEYTYLTIYRSTNSGASGSDIYNSNTPITDANDNGALFIAPFILDPNNQERMYAGAVRLWRSNNVREANAADIAWTAVKAAVAGNPKISAIAVAPHHPNIVWVGYDNGRVDVSADTGATWNQVGNGVLPSRYCMRITVDPNKPSRAYALFGGYSQANIWRTEDTGATWYDVNTNATVKIPSVPMRSLVVWPRNSDSIYCGTEIGVYASVDSGKNWSPANDGPTNTAVDELFLYNTDTLYAVTHGRGMWRIHIACPDTTPPANDTSGPNAWYVNDTSAAGDSFTTAIGSDANSGVTRSAPRRTLAAVTALLTPGDTVYVDAGVYTEAVTLAVDSVALIGVDSSASGTVLRAGDSATTTVYGISASARVNLLISDLRVEHSYHTLRFVNVDRSAVRRSTFRLAGQWGAYLNTNSDTNVFENNIFQTSSVDGVVLDNSSRNATFHGNVISENARYGLYLVNGSGHSTFTDMVVDSNGNDGVRLDGSGGGGNTFTGTISRSNAQSGYLVDVPNNSFVRCVSRDNRAHGFFLDGTGNVLTACTIDSNANWGLRRVNNSGYDVVSRSNYSGSPTRPDSGVQNNSGDTMELTRIWWGTADSQAIRNKLFGAGAALIQYIPFRLGPVDTAAGADTIAPGVPTAVSVDSPYGQIRISWNAPAGNEDGHAGATGVTKYRVYRSRSVDTSIWVAVGETTATIFSDTTTAADTVYYYRVTAVDGASPYPNESFFSAVVAGTSTRAVGDLDGDSTVGRADVQILENFIRQNGWSAYDLRFDIGKFGIDNRINYEDFLELGRRYGL
jgi:photosystem II stability/assembly factor-like uncharacterized protein